jgi:hypothetical protein
MDKDVPFMLCRAHVAWLALLLCGSAGCLSDQPSRGTGWLDRLRVNTVSAADTIYIEYVLIERPLGDHAMNRVVWSETDEQILPSEVRTIVNNNGYRIGTISGMFPSELDAMIQNPHSAEGHRQRRIAAGYPAAFALNGPVPSSEFQVRLNSESVPTTVRREQAQFSLDITPVVLADGRLQLKCVPEVEYHDKKFWNPIGAVGPGWGGSKPSEKYPALAFDINISSKEFLVIGAFEKPTTLGYQTFVSAQSTETVQKLMILHAGRMKAESFFSEKSLRDTTRVVPIAAQASQGRAQIEND